MKGRSIRFFSFHFLFFGFLFSAQAFDALYFNESDNSLGGMALNNLSFVVTTVTSESAFQTQLTSQPWDIVVVERYMTPFSPEAANSLVGYTDAGGRAVLSYYDLDGSDRSDSAAVLRSGYGITNANDLAAQSAVYTWNGSPLSTTPNAVDVVNPGAASTYLDHGDRLSGGANLQELGGLSSTPSEGQALVLFASVKRSIINGFLYDEMDETGGTDLMENEITYLIAIPEPLTFGLLALGLVVTGRRLIRRFQLGVLQFLAFPN